VNVSENAPPGMSIAEFIVNCTYLNSNISVTLQSVTPPTAFFNPPTISSSDTITLSPAAALDARQVNQYTLVLQAQCPAEELVETQLFVQVRPEDAAPQCMGKFASAGKAGTGREGALVRWSTHISRNWGNFVCMKCQHGLV
uniref:Cadherin related family member 4 n=1 Tax=Crocodylus porosus TaxID=8502 RepID=A0A7M4FC88_CROPO